MPPGPKPKPQSLKLLAGNPGKRALNTREPVLDDAPTPEAPETLSKSAQAVWRKMAPILHRMGTLTPADVRLFQSYCAACATFDEADQALSQEHAVNKLDSGYRTQSAWLKVRTDMDKRIQSLGAELGLSASARTRIVVDKPKKATGNARFFTAG